MSTPLIRTFGSTVLLALSLTFAGCQGYGPGPTAQPMAPLFGPSGSAPHQAPPPTYAATPRPVAQPAPRPAPTPAPAPKPGQPEAQPATTGFRLWWGWWMGVAAFFLGALGATMAAAGFGWSFRFRRAV